jgi:sigma-E factor negative regulatory protein RseC
MIEESVEVIAIEDDVLILQAQRKSSCQSCSVQKGCGTSVLSQWLGKKLSNFRVENTVDAQVGDYLIVGISESSILKGSLSVYFMPLMSLFLFALLADWLLPEAVYRDLWVGVSGILGLFAGLGFCKVLLGRQSAANLNPVILRKSIEHVKLAP